MDIRFPRFGSLTGDRHFDVVVVGAGITGMSTALMLKRQGRSVAVVEAASVGSGETSRTTAHLTCVLDGRLSTLIKRFGKEDAARAVKAHSAAIDWIEKTVHEAAIDCRFARVPGHLFSEAGDKAGGEVIAKEADAAAKIGLAVEPCRDLRLPISVGAALRFPNQAQLHPLAYLRGLANAFLKGEGGAIYDDTRVLSVDDGEPCRVQTERGTIICSAVVLATHVPLNRIMLHAKLEPMRSYVIARTSELPDDAGLFWDTADPYHYWRTARLGDETLLLVGGRDHGVGEPQQEDNFAALEQHARERLGEAEVRYRWSGQIMEPVDGLPFIGHNAFCTRVFVATGYSGNGMTGATAAGLIMCGEIEGAKHPLAQVFSATRGTPVASVKGFVRQNALAAKNVLFDRRRMGKPENVDDLAPNDGRVVRVDGQPVAVFKKPDGRLEIVSAVCTHLGCVVNFNGTEKTWDCPCHGSRFATDGTVLHGPAVEALAPHDLDTHDKEGALVETILRAPGALMTGRPLAE
jgi:glycine/D-amino acid oxidase-like deaminating enzyme/nitrite reductase/ring-hydroxylating ferredoxin subunit